MAGARRRDGERVKGAARTVVVTVPCDRIVDWPSFHAVFQELFGFPAFYGRNMDAWIDCMSDLDQETALVDAGCAKGEVVTLAMEGATAFKRRCPDQFEALIDCSAFVNRRRSEMGELPILMLRLDH